MYATLTFVLLALLCIVAGAVVIRRRRAVFRMDDDAGSATLDTEAPSSATVPDVAGGGLGSRVRALFGSGVSDTTWNGLEDLLIKADVGPRGSADLVQRVRDKYEPGTDPADVLRCLLYTSPSPRD